MFTFIIVHIKFEKGQNPLLMTKQTIAYHRNNYSRLKS